jgi:hypothetical protein
MLVEQKHIHLWDFVLLPSRKEVRITNGINEIRTEKCCFVSAGGHILLLDQNANTSYIEDEMDADSTPELKLNSSMILIGVETLPGQPEIVKVARNGC